MQNMKPGIRLLRGGVAMALLLLAANVGAATNPPPKPGRILIIRGIFSVFSLGMDRLACELAQQGYRVDVTPPSMAILAANEIEQEYRRDPSAGPLAVIGHSLGGRLCCVVPWRWRESGIPVKLVVILDANPLQPVPDNVQRCVNLHVTNDLGIFHGRDTWAVSPATNLVNLDMTKVKRPPGVPSVDHFSIDDSDWIHGLVIEEVNHSLGTPTPHALPRTEPRFWREGNVTTGTDTRHVGLVGNPPARIQLR